jgi:hypothetical protein
MLVAVGNGLFAVAVLLALFNTLSVPLEGTLLCALI